MSSRPDPDLVSLAYSLRYEAQNNQMIDNHYTEAGALMLRASEALESLARANVQIPKS
jgi:hypothetical protein